MRTRRVGAHAVLVDLDGIDDVHRVWRHLRSGPPPGASDVVAGAASVLVVFEPGADPSLPDLDAEASSYPVGRHLEIPVEYGGPDLGDVAELTGVDPSEVARRHAAARYTVAFVGFSPGFAYLIGGDPELRVPRLPTPRRSVPAGSVAVAADMTAVYPQSTPGGWRLIGRTDAVLFDPARPEPSLLEPGDHVRFRPTARVGPAPAWPAAGRPSGGGSGPWLKVLDAGPLLTVQDRGRAGWAHLGVPRGGAADRASATRANLAVGNGPGAALLEATLAGPRLLLGAPRLVAVTGARAAVTVDGLPARQDVALPVPAGAEILVGPATAGARTYIAVEGGVDVEPVLGSRSTDTLSGLGPPALRSGDVLTVGGPTSGPRSAGGPPPELPGAGDLVIVAAVRGPRHDWVGPAGMDTLSTAEFVVSTASDRTGVRLEGPAVRLERAEEAPSEGVVPGAVQVPPGGQPIVLLRNHPATGGYPVAAVVDDAGVDLLAQARPGVRVRFRLLETGVSR